jgi:hypothetical protein
MAIVMRPSDSRAAADLALFLCKQGCGTIVSEDGTITVEPPHDLHVQQARMEVELYVRLWQALHGLRVDLLHCAAPTAPLWSGKNVPA